MERQLERCCGLDVHKETVAACVRVGGRTGKAEQHVQTFGTTVGDLLVLRDWLAAHGVTHVAMESTGVYWKPVFYTLEHDFTCLLFRPGLDSVAVPSMRSLVPPHGRGMVRVSA